MNNSFSQTIRISLDSYNKGRITLPKKLGNAAINHFKDNWRKQGFDDSTVNPWKRRKGNKDPGRAILVKTGRLRRSFAMSVLNAQRIIVTNDTPYGVYHNYGYSANMEASTRASFFKTKIKGDGFLKMGKNGKYKMSYKTKTVELRGADRNIGAHTRVMPQRKFMGRSRNLDEKSGVLIMRMMKAALK